MSPPSGWEGILDEDEEVLWQGRPDNRIVFRMVYLLSGALGLFFAGFAVVWMVMVAQTGGFAWMFGLIHFSVGLAIGIGPPLWSAWTRRHTWYTLTDRRAFIATDLPLRGRRLKSYPIDDDTVLDYRDGDPPTVYFAHEMRRTKNGSRRVDIGFERIADGQEVYRLMRQVQRGQDKGADLA